MQETLDRIFFVLFAISFFTGCDFSCGREKENNEGLGFISSVKNTVYYKNFRSLVWTKAAEKIPVFGGDYIRTAENSSAVIQIEDDKLVIGENTLIKIEKRRPDRDEGMPVELVILNGDIAVEEGGDSSRTVTVKRLSGGKLKTEEISRLKLSKADISDVYENEEDLTELLYPCENEILSINNPVFRWNGKRKGLLKIYRDKAEHSEILIEDEESRQVELEDGSYEWEILLNGRRISTRCSFGISARPLHNEKVGTGRRKVKDISPKLSGKQDEIVQPAEKTNENKSDMVQKRLSDIQKVIDRSMEHIVKTRKSIDPEKVKNYAQIYGKLDELSRLLMELRVIQEALLMEVIKLDNPKVIVKYLNELEDIEKNLRGIDEEIRNIEKTVMSDGIKPGK